MHVSESICNPKVCNYECLDACTSTHGNDAPLGFGKESLIPVIDQHACTECLACIRACPLDAISVDDSPLVSHEIYPPPVEISKTSQKPYEVSETLSRMSEASLEGTARPG